MHMTFKICFFVFCLMTFFHKTHAEPMVILEFNSNKPFQKGDGTNKFFLDENHFEKYLIKSGDTLASIQKRFYKGSGLNSQLVRLAIIIMNPDAFVKENPNFMFSNKELYLPGKKNIEDILIGKEIKQDLDLDTKPLENIFFFGG